MKPRISLAILIITALILSGCTGGSSKASEYQKYSYEFLGAFDTVFQIMGYAKTKKEFEELSNYAQNRFMELHKLYDIYNDYQGIANVKTINDNAGIKPVKVEQEIIDLIAFSKEWNKKTNGKINIALGSMLYIWHQYREAGIENPEKAELPPIKALQEAMAYTDIDKVIVDDANNTIFLADKNMRLDVGSVAKGFACEAVSSELKAKGYDSFIISAGGNVRAVGAPLDGVRKKWGIGIQNPNGNPLDPEDPPLDIIFLANQSVVTSGDYQRYYTVEGKKYHHIIDPDTLMPGDYYRSVTVVTEDSGIADYLDTDLFLLPYEEGRLLAEKLGVEVIWVMKDGTIRTTDKIKSMMKNLGGAKSNQ